MKKAVSDVLNGDSKKDDNKALKEAAVAVPVVALVIAGEAWHRGGLAPAVLCAWGGQWCHRDANVSSTLLCMYMCVYGEEGWL